MKSKLSGFNFIFSFLLAYITIMMEFINLSLKEFV